MNLAQRLGVDDQRAEAYGLVEGGQLRHPVALIDEACSLGPNDPGGAQVKLATAALSAAQLTTEGRHRAVLSLIAPLIANADPMMTLGPKGAALRAEIMPNGWKHTLASWPRLRYAWREGMPKLLEVDMDRFGPVVNAINEVTRLTSAEPEPVSVAIQDQWPSPPIAFTLSLVGTAVSMWGIYKGVSS